MNPKRDHAGIFVPPPFLYAIPFAAGMLLHRTVGGDSFPPSIAPAARIAGLALLAAGILLALASEILFARAGTSAIPIRPTQAIVTGGPYRFTRNPMYLSLAIDYVGLTLVVGYAWPFAGLLVAILAVDRYAIPREERYLEGKFGDSYRQYRQSVRRWL
ncbi:MAG TPA: isoprenylcysteine carboxylmethyltransferase family protein [Candidatus Eisenbacteria bacterium]|nr:isoprenylcysteine carboxylmethyltransferase family protein [Candidatus Eisenbacteria bacterium]